VTKTQEQQEKSSQFQPLPSLETYWDGFGWIGHPSCDARDGKLERLFIERRHDVRFVCGATDQNASYSYDETAVCALDGEFYVAHTSGCSCPSPSETWSVDYGPLPTLAAVAEVLRTDKKLYLPDNERNALLAALAALEPKS
jgi:hypothetical protein